MANEYLESRDGSPNEIMTRLGKDTSRFWLEQDDDMIELDAQQASLLIKSLTAFLETL